MRRSSPSSSMGSRSSSSHSNSSAFSPNANPHEDWTKISDLAERRRIQNRIAQRNYRKKLKRRLEDLERRASSSSSSPEPPKSVPVSSTKPRSRPSDTKSTSEATRSPEERGDSHTNRQDDCGAMFSHQSTRQLSASPPPVFSHASPYHSHLDGSLHSPMPIYSAVLGSYGYDDLCFARECGEHVPPVLPRAAAAGPIKQMHHYADEEIMSPFSMSYATMAGIDLCQTLPEMSLTMSVLSQPFSSPPTPPDMPVVSGPFMPESDGFFCAHF